MAGLSESDTDFSSVLGHLIPTRQEVLALFPDEGQTGYGITLGPDGSDVMSLKANVNARAYFNQPLSADTFAFQQSSNAKANAAMQRAKDTGAAMRLHVVYNRHCTHA